MTEQTLQRRIALVTGGTTGIGFGSAKRLLQHGAIVYITGRRKEVLDAAVAKLGQGAHGIQADASVKADMQRVADTIQAAHGKLDVLFANAGGGFNVFGPEVGRDSLLLGAGVAVMLNERTSTYVYYDGELLRDNYDAHNVSGGIRVTF